jgi:hypothetical protein
MKCELCEYRFICFTLANNERPKRVRVNWKITNTCGNCKNAEYGTKAKGYTTVTRPVGYCEKTKQIVHKNSTACDQYLPKKVAQVDKMYAEINEVVALKNKKTKLPKYCIIEDR